MVKRVAKKDWLSVMLAFTDALIVSLVLFGLRLPSSFFYEIGLNTAYMVLYPVAIWAACWLYLDIRLLVGQQSVARTAAVRVAVRLCVSLVVLVFFFPYMLILWDPTRWSGA
jgi:hypothetical protein